MKEDLFKTIYIEKLNLEKELITKSNNVKLNLFRKHLKDY